MLSPRPCECKTSKHVDPVLRFYVSDPHSVKTPLRYRTSFLLDIKAGPFYMTGHN